MKTEAHEILLECHRREQAHRASKRPKCPPWDSDAYDATTQLGPEWSTSWFGQWLPDALRMRYSRALRELIRSGLVEPFSLWSRISRIRLTPAGEREAERLAAELEAQP